MIWFYKMEQKYGKYAIKNLTWYLIICYAIGYVLEISAGMGNTVTANLLSYMTLDIHAVLHGQIWRLVTWLLIPPGSFDIFTLVMLYCYFNIGNLLERTWGTFKYNVFMFSGVIFTVIGAFLLYGILAVVCSGMPGGMEESLAVMSNAISYMFSTYYVSMSIFLAFAITYPDAQMLFMFVIPIKTKVLGVIYVLLMIYEICMAFSQFWLYGLATAVVIGFSLLNVLLFFIVTRKSFRTPTQMKRQKDFQRHVVKMKKVTRHKCAICGRTEETDPDEQFRFCSKCEGSYEYCSKHIYTHTHIKSGQQ
ncbi:MAG: hypothetical protein ACI4AA_03050 [Lachnospiraceae bacterium]